MSEKYERRGGGGNRGRGGGRGGRGGGYRRTNFQDQQMDPIPIKRPPRPPISDDVLSCFQQFQTELDFRHDKYERLVKTSRSITIDSKRTIFLLHRAVASSSSPADFEAILMEAEDKLAGIRVEHWTRIGQELEGEDPYCFIRAYSPGLQEYIEAATFAGYLRNRSLLSWSDIQSSLSDLPSVEEKTLPVAVPLIDYLSGVADLTGELMRAAINSIASGDQHRPQQICQFLNHLYGGFSLFSAVFTFTPKDWSMKMRTFRQSLAKVENVCYVFKLRGTEIPDYMLAEAMAGDAQFGQGQQDDGQFENW